MNIVIVTNRFPELSETFVLDHIIGLVDLGHDVSICSLAKPVPNSKIHEDVLKYNLLDKTFYLDIPYADKEQSQKCFWIIIRHLNKLSLILKCLRGRDNRGHILRDIIRLKPFLKKKFDIIHCHFGVSAHEMIFLKDIFPETKFITTFHGYDISKIVLQQGGAFYQNLFEKGDLFLPVSDYWKRRLIKLGCPEGKIRVHHVGINLDEFAFRQPLDANGRPLVLLSVGRLVEKKGHEWAIRALERLVTQYPSLVYKIGGDGPLRKKLEDLIYELSLEQNVQFLGPVEKKEVLKLYQETDIFVLPSVTAQSGDMEGIPVVLMEAMAIGIPVVSTFHSGIPELVKNGQNGFLVEERDSKELAKKLEFLIKDRGSWEGMGRNGRETVEKRFNLQSLNKELVKIYEELVG